MLRIYNGVIFTPPHYYNREGYVSKHDNIVTYENNPEHVAPNIYQIIYFLKNKKHKLPKIVGTTPIIGATMKLVNSSTIIIGLIYGT